MHNVCKDEVLLLWHVNKKEVPQRLSAAQCVHLHTISLFEYLQHIAAIRISITIDHPQRFHLGIHGLAFLYAART